MASTRPNGRQAQGQPRSTQELAVSHVRLENWRNFGRVDTALQRRAFLVGPNAAGKSNMLDAFRFLADLVSVGGGFQEAVDRRGGVSRIRSLSARRYPEVKLQVGVGVPGEQPVWEYQLAFTQDNRQVPRVAHERVTHEGRELLRRPNDEDRADPARLTQTYLEQVNVNREYRGLADFLSSIGYLQRHR
jgi:predicted ATPase